MNDSNVQKSSVLVLVDNEYEELELWYPVIRLQENGHKVILAGPKAQTRYTGKHGYPCESHISFTEMGTDWDAIVIPGGYSPEKICQVPEVLEVVKKLHKQSKVIAFICHGGLVPIAAGIVDGKKVTGTSKIQDEFKAAGAVFLDEALVIDKNFISSRRPSDLHLFGKAIVDAL